MTDKLTPRKGCEIVTDGKVKLGDFIYQKDINKWEAAFFCVGYDLYGFEVGTVCRSIKGANVNITIDDSKLPKPDPPPQGMEFVSGGVVEKGDMRWGFKWHRLINGVVGSPLHPQFTYCRPIKGANVNTTIGDNYPKHDPPPQGMEIATDPEAIVQKDWMYWGEISKKWLPTTWVDGDIISDAFVWCRPIPQLPELDILGSMHKFDTEKVTGEIMTVINDLYDEIMVKDFTNSHKGTVSDRIRDILEEKMADERNEAHVCKCNVKED